MIEKFFGFNLDFAGAATAAVCALHCTAFPILLSLGLISSTHHSHMFDWIMMSVGIVIAGYILVKDYAFFHKNVTPLVTAVLGFVALFAGIETHGNYIFLNILGGLLIVASHFFNWRLNQSK